MTVSTSTARIQYATNGTTGPFTIPFPFLDPAHLRVVKTTSGVETTLVLSTDYSVTGGTASGTLTTTAAYPSGSTLTIERSIPILQSLDLADGDELSAESLERAFDLLTMIAQQISRTTDSSLRVPETATALPLLPSASARANRTLAFDSAGNPTVLVPEPGTASAVLTDLANNADTSKGDALVAVKRSDTGFAATTLHVWLQRSKLRLKDFGAAMDGTTDDTTALTTALAAIDAYGGGELQLGIGTCRITSSVTIPHDLTLTGEARDVSRIKVDAAVVGLSKTYATHTDLNRLNLLVRGIGFIGSASALGAVQLTRPDYFEFEHCLFRDFTAAGAYGLNWVGAWRGGVSHSHFENITAHGVKMATADGVGCNQTHLSHNEIIGNNQVLFVGALLTGQNVLVTDNDLSGSSNGLHALQIEGCEGLIVRRNYIELWTGQAIKANTGTANKRVLVEGNVLNSLGVPCLDFDHAGVNDRVTVCFNRFPDMGAGQTCAKAGATLRFREYGNDPDTSSMTTATVTSSDPVSSNTGMFTGTITGCTTSPTGTVRFEVLGNTVRLELPSILGTSNTTGLTMTGIPDRLKPARNQVDSISYRDNGTDNRGQGVVDTLGVITAQNNAGSSAIFTASGQKGFGGGCFCYALT